MTNKKKINKKGKIYMLEHLGYGLRIFIIAGFIATAMIVIYNVIISFIEWSKDTYKRLKKNIKERFNSHKKEREEYKRRKETLKNISKRIKQKRILKTWNEYLIELHTEKILEECQDYSIEEIESIYKYISEAITIDIEEFPYDKKGSDKLIKEIEKLLLIHGYEV
jgi:hypothetical protein